MQLGLLGRTAAQSTTANDSASGLPLGAALALGTSPITTCSQTQGEPAGPWWCVPGTADAGRVLCGAGGDMNAQHTPTPALRRRRRRSVDLEQTTAVTFVTLTNSLDAGGAPSARLTKLEVRVGATDPSANPTANPLCARIMGALPARAYVIACPTPLVGRWLSVRLVPGFTRVAGEPPILQLCGVAVLGAPLASPPPSPPWGQTISPVNLGAAATAQASDTLPATTLQQAGGSWGLNPPGRSVGSCQPSGGLSSLAAASANFPERFFVWTPPAAGVLTITLCMQRDSSLGYTSFHPAVYVRRGDGSELGCASLPNEPGLTGMQCTTGQGDALR